jgi:hypothetical protein
MRGSAATLNPASSTYYSHRVFMIYEPDDFRDYLGKIVAGPLWRETEQARHLMAWGTLLVYQARMDPFKFNEYMNRYIDDAGRFRPGYEFQPNSNPLFRMQLAMQLALEAVTRRANIRGRIDDQPARAQLVFDTLYYIAFLHAQDRRAGDPRPEKKADEQPYVFRVDQTDLQDYLRRRAEGDRGSGLPADFPGEDECRFLFALFREYIDLLSRPDEIRERTLDFAPLQSGRRIGTLWEDLAFAILPENVVALAESAKADEIAFWFRMDRYGLNPDERDPFELATEAGAALGAWESLLRELLGDPAEATRIAAGARLLERFPEWEPVSDARRRSVQTVETDAVELRRAALLMRDYLRMLYQWSTPFARGATAAALAAAARTGEPPARRRVALEALRVLCGFDPRDPPERTAARLGDQFGAKAWPFPFAAHLPPEPGRRVSFAEAPGSLTGFSADLSAAVRSFDTDIEWADPGSWTEVWADFWAQWRFPSTGVDAERVDPANPSLALDLLHAVRHGAIPVMPSRSGNLSIGEWCRLLTLAWSKGETVPERAIAAALTALGFPEEADEPLPGRAERERPILLISVGSTRSAAWQWRPQPGVRGLMRMPPDIIAAEGWPPEDHLEAAEQILSRRGLRSSRILHCIETGLDIPPRYEPVYFGAGRPPETAGGHIHIANPTSVADLAERVRRAEEARRELSSGPWVLRRFRELLHWAARGVALR